MISPLKQKMYYFINIVHFQGHYSTKNNYKNKNKEVCELNEKEEK
jgi:hypothetical protein